MRAAVAGNRRRGIPYQPLMEPVEFKPVGSTRIHIYLAAMVVVFMCAGVPPVVAQVPVPGVPPEEFNGMIFKNFLKSSGYESQLINYTLSYEKGLGPCSKPLIQKRVRATPLKRPVTFAGVGTPPQWLEIIEIGGCKKTFERTIFTAIVKGKIRHVALLRGKSFTDPRLQWDIIKAILPAARIQARKKGCKRNSVRMIGAKAEGERDPGDKSPWNETWVMADCDGVFEYEVSLTPDPKGGTTWAAKRK